MAGASTPPLPALPHVWRPGFARWTAYGVAAFTVLFLGGVALLVPLPFGRDPWSLDRVLLVLVALVVAALALRFARVRVVADDEGLLVVNAFGRRRLAWAQVVAVRLTPSDAWAQLDLADGTTCGAMAVQTADGKRGRRMADELAAYVGARAGTEPTG